MHKTQTQSTESICPSDPTVHKTEMLKGKKETLTRAGGGWNQIYATQVNLSVPSIVALKIRAFGGFNFSSPGGDPGI